MSVGKSVNRVDAFAKVTGEAKYVEDFLENSSFLHAKVVRSTIANGLVKSIDTKEAEKLPGVVKIVTCFDVPDFQFPTAGHPWSTDTSHRDVADRKLLNQRVRIYGDDIAAVIAEDEVTASRAVNMIKVEYEEYKAIKTVEDAMAPGAGLIHDERDSNVLVHSNFEIGDFEEAIKDDSLKVYEGEYDTQVVQHCHIETPVSYAWTEKDRVTCVSSTQIPHIVRRVVGQATGIPWGKIRVIKPYIGGGFGNKQEVLYEPLNCYLATLVPGRKVFLSLSREETFTQTRTRHAIKFKIKSYVKPNGRLVARQVAAYSNQGGYASHGHSIVANSVTALRQLYQDEKAIKGDAYTVYTNLSSGGAMRGYGIPQSNFAIESHVQEIIEDLGLDPVEFRKLNCMKQGYVDPVFKIKCYTSGLEECIDKGKAHIDFDAKYKKYGSGQTGDKRRGVGMAIFTYKTGVYPISLETASCRMVLNQDGSVQVQMGATEIGQGADTVFAQMASETLGFTMDKINMISTQDTDVTPFDTAAYASRQTYVSGTALKKTAEMLRGRIIEYAGIMLDSKTDNMDIKNDFVVDKNTGKELIAVSDVAVEAFYSLDDSRHLTAEVTNHMKNNTYAFGVCFVEVEVDIPLGKVEVLDIINVHDSGILINPQLAGGQVHGGMSMGLGAALGEQILYDDNCKPLNNNFLDYKLPTSMDTPELHADFVETDDESGPYGNKALGEPPAIPIGPAIRNAVLNATGVAINSLPLTPPKLVEAFTEKGLI